MTIPGRNSASWCEQLYEREAPRLLLYGRALGLGHSESEDVLHDTFKALLQLTGEPDEPRAYLVRSFRNRALNFRRSLWRRLARELESQRWFEGGPQESPRERAAMAVLAGLPVEQREVIVLKIWHGLTFDEIGRLLELSPNTVAGRYRYGLQRIRAALEGKNHAELESEPIAFLETTFPFTNR